MVIIIRHFLVDSENVNDNWLMLFDMADEDDEIIVFYTKKSPHMSYMSVIRLMENNKINIRFEESYEGTNALDFQLVSYMGYLMGCAVHSVKTNVMLHQPSHVLMSTS
ncbi:MAG: PIN domain-containing protein [Agathobacter rectalis]